jgi:hypothetical protein
VSDFYRLKPHGGHPDVERCTRGILRITTECNFVGHLPAVVVA